MPTWRHYRVLIVRKMHMDMQMHSHIDMHIHIHVHVHVPVPVPVHVPVHVHLHVHVHICMRIHIHIHIYIHTYITDEKDIQFYYSGQLSFIQTHLAGQYRLWRCSFMRSWWERQPEFWCWQLHTYWSLHLSHLGRWSPNYIYRVLRWYNAQGFDTSWYVSE